MKTMKLAQEQILEEQKEREKMKKTEDADLAAKRLKKEERRKKKMERDASKEQVLYDSD